MEQYKLAKTAKLAKLALWTLQQLCNELPESFFTADQFVSCVRARTASADFADWMALEPHEYNSAILTALFLLADTSGAVKCEGSKFWFTNRAAFASHA